VGQIKGLLSQGSYAMGELDNLTKLGKKGSLPEQHFTANKKELLTLSQGEGKAGSY
jgi:hypothetical protein